MSAAPEPAPVIMVSSTVYRYEELLEKIFGVLNGFGYRVWMSYKGTLPVDPRRSNFDNCLEAVAKCDLFLGLITPYYGSGKEAGGLSITHRELLRAIELNKPRWFLAHAHIPFARQLLRQYRFTKTGRPRKGFRFETTGVLDDVRVLEMYEAAIRAEVRVADRTGNWVQEFLRFEDALQYISAQLGDVQRIRELLRRREP